MPGPTADRTLLKESGLLGRRSPDCAIGGDRGYSGLDKLHPRGHTPRRTPRGKPRPPEDSAYNQARARQRVRVEHTSGEVRRFACRTQTDRQRRRQHTARVRAVAGLLYRRRHRHARRRRHAALVNGAAGVVNMADGQPVSVMSFTITRGKIVAIDILADPDRLRRLDLTVLGN